MNWSDLYASLVKDGHSYLFVSDDAQKHILPAEAVRKPLISQLLSLNKAYPGGILQYIRQGRRLFRDIANKVLPLGEFSVSPPPVVALPFPSAAFRSAESSGVAVLCSTAFVLVAGGLGERLGWPGIKVGVTPSLLLPEMTMLEWYFGAIKRLEQHQQMAPSSIPFVIMTSAESHDATEALLKTLAAKGYPTKPTLLQQGLVPAFADPRGTLATQVSADGMFRSVVERPHGHGDVHVLLARAGLLADWAAKGITRVAFLQDSNVLLFRGLLVLAGVAGQRDAAMAFAAAPRRPKDAMGGLVLARRVDASRDHTVDGEGSPPSGTTDDESMRLVNVEYCHLDVLLSSSGGDVASASCMESLSDGPLSPLPGNNNTFMLKLDVYRNALSRTEPPGSGAMSEFVNPKWKSPPVDLSSAEFASPCRLECMMQDIAWFLSASEAASSLVVAAPRWAIYCPTKNSLAAGCKAAAQGAGPSCIISAEVDMWMAHGTSLAEAWDFALPDVTKSSSCIPGLSLYPGPAIVLTPDALFTTEELASRKHSGTCRISSRSVFVCSVPIVLDGNIDIDGAVCISGDSGATIAVRRLKVRYSEAEAAIASAGLLAPSDNVRGAVLSVTPKKLHFGVGHHIVDCEV